MVYLRQPCQPCQGFFYTLIQRKAEFESQGYHVEELDDGLIKVWRPLDTIDTLDAGAKARTSLAEKLEKLEMWLLENRDPDGLIDSALLASKIKDCGLDVQQTIQLLKNEGWLRDVPVLGKLGVK